MNFKNIKKCKRSQGGVFGMSFAMIFSIILIVFFIIIAFIAIKAFLDWQKCANTGLLLDNIRTEIDVNAWRSNDYYNPKFTEPVPSGVEYVCFVNMSNPPGLTSTSIEKSIYDHIKIEGFEYKYNLYLYSSKPFGCSKWSQVKHIDMSGRNPICLKAVNGQVTMKIERKFDYTAVKVS